MARRLAHSLSFIFFNICAHVVRSQIVDQCQAPIEWNNATHKREYTVGVLAIRGFPAAYSEFNKTFTEYLTETAGKMFNPPVRFQMKALDFLLLFTDTATANVDFFYVNPSAFSCIESEYGASSLVSQISERIVDGQVYKLTKFGGVIFSLSNSTINTVEDLKDRSIAAASISGLGSGQMQFRVLQQAGLSYINDPSQVVFTSDQGSVVSGVINGDWDVGFVRTDQIESTLDADGKPIDRTLLKVIDPIKGLEIDGNPFPFASSTPLYAEWNVAALPHVSDDASIAVQNALLKLEAHASAGVPIVQCYTDRNCNGTNSYASPEECQQSCHDDFFSNPIRCDTTPELAVIAQMARSTGKYSGWRSTLSYMDLRNMQEETGFIVKNPENGTMQCIRSSNIYDAIVCPPGHFKKSEYEVINSCINMGLGCKEGYQCVCKPCVKAFDVDIFANPVSASLSQHFSGRTGCDKFAICGSVQQTKTIQFAAVDNKKRDNLNLVVRLHEGSTPRDIKGVLVPDSNYTYVFSLETNRVGVVVMQIFADNQQIPESPLRVSVVPRDCALDYNDGLRVPDSEGECVCSANSVQMGARCVSIAILIPSILVPLLVVAGVVIYLYIERKKKQADSVWAVKVNELLFDDPPLIIGRGTFGLVLLAEYRGTQVAVKRVIPPKFELKSKVHQSVQRASFLGSGDMEDISDEFSGTLSGNFVNTSDTTTAVVSNSHNKHQHEFGEGEIVGDTNQLQEKQLLECAVDTSAPTDNPDIENELGPGNADQHASQFNLERSKSEGETVLTQTKKKVAWAVNKTRRASLNLDSCNIEEHKQKQSLPTRRASCIPFGSASIPSSDSLGNLKVNAFGPFKTRKADTKRSALDIAFDFDQDTVERRLSYQGDQKTESIQKVTDVGTQIGSSLEVEMGTAVEEIGDNIKTSNMTSSDFRVVQPNQGVESAWTSGWADVGKGTESDFRSGWGSAGMLSKQSTLYNSSLKPSKPSSSGNRKGLEKIKKFVTFGRKDEYNKLKADFISEMRHLSKLRHPCITTVMGAVISKFDEPMLVMEYMDHGSLYDILHNETMVVDGELLLPILRDIAQGVRFLHTAEPQVIHGDLKAQNVLVDGKFRAKVADFGLSQKKKVGATGTPYWMAPELLRGERPNNASTDVYSFGIILYEAYSRKVSLNIFCFKLRYIQLKYATFDFSGPV